MNEPNESPTLDLATTTTKTRANFHRQNDQIKTNRPKKQKEIFIFQKKDTLPQRDKNKTIEPNWTWTRP
jgi:hypothetical protein